MKWQPIKWQTIARDGILLLFLLLSPLTLAATTGVNGAYPHGAPLSSLIDVPCDVNALIDAINAANSTPGTDTLRLASDCIYTLTDAYSDFYGATGLPVITGPIVIEGDRTTIRRSGVPGIPQFRIFATAGGADLTLNRLTVRGGSVGGEGGAILNRHGTLTLNGSSLEECDASGHGGALSNREGTVTLSHTGVWKNRSGDQGGGIFGGGGTLTVMDSDIGRNQAGSYGGGISNRQGALTVTGSTIRINRAQDHGGGIATWRPSSVIQVTSSSVHDNSTDRNGGGLYALGGELILADSTVSGNRADRDGGGLAPQECRLTLTNSTVSGNRAAHAGGGMRTALSTVTLTNSTVTGNEAGSGGGGIHSFSGVVNLHNTIVAAQAAGADCSGPGDITSQGHNLDGDGTCVTGGVNGDFTADPLLGPLRGSGGRTQTHALLAVSPAIDAGDDAACPATDQRGMARPQDGNVDGTPTCDIGAYEATLGAVIPVTTSAPEVSLGDGECSLKEAIHEAQNPGFASASGDCLPGSLEEDLIDLQAPGPYVLTAVDNIDEDNGANGLPAILSPIAIRGNGATIARSDARGTPPFRIFSLADLLDLDASLTLYQVTVRNGYLETSCGGGIYTHWGTVNLASSTITDNQAYAGGGMFFLYGRANLIHSTVSYNRATRSGGGGIYMGDGPAHLWDSTVSGNMAIGSGGGIVVIDDTINLTRSTVNGNHAGANGGGLYMDAMSEAALTGSTVDGNTAIGSGGGMFCGGQWILSLSRSTISNNSAGREGGGLWYEGGTLTIDQSTIRGNDAASRGGGLFAQGYGGEEFPSILTNSTVSGNRAADGGGLYGRPLTLVNSTISGNQGTSGVGGLVNAGDTVILANTIIANQASGSDCGGTSIDSLGHNLDSDGTCVTAGVNGDLTADPLLGPLQDNGGPTETHALLPGSPAVDAGDDALCPTTDQRGIARPQDGDGDGRATCDIGAYEHMAAYGESHPIEPGDAPPVDFPTVGFTLDCSSGPGGTVTVSVHHTDYAAPPNGVSVMSAFWDVTSTFGTPFACDLTFHYDEGDLNGAAEADIAGAARWDEGNVVWEYLGGVVDAGANTVTVRDVTAFSPWLLLTSSPPQAVADLAGARSGNNLQLSWSAVTGDIRGNVMTPDHYVVYRCADEPYFVPVAGDIVATTSTPSFTDPGILGDPAHNYTYLVTAVDAAGRESAPSSRLEAFDFSLTPAAQAGERACNLIAMNLKVPWMRDADALAAYVGRVYMVLHHDAATQGIEWRLPGLAGVNFPVEVGEVYLLYLDEAAPLAVSLVGRVPARDEVSLALARPAPGGSCAYNFISLPLHRDDLADADALAADIGGVYTVSRYDAETQDLTWRMPGVAGENFPVRAGYPYIVCLDESAPSQWP